MNPVEISVVVPFFNEEESLPLFIEKLETELEKTKKSYEIICVNDGSTDRSLEIAYHLAEKMPALILIDLQGNFGKSAALAAGFDYVHGEYIFTMDADLQDNPKEIPRFLEAIADGNDVVSGWKKIRHDPLGKVIPSRIFNWIIRKASGLTLHDINCGFKCYRQQVIKELPVYGEMHRFLPILAHWKRFKVSEIVVEHQARQFGVSKFGVSRLMRGFFDFLTVFFLMRFDKRPMHLFGLVGLISSSLGFVACGYLSILWLLTRWNIIHAGPIGTRPLLSFGILLIVVGFLFFGIGLLAELINYHLQDKQKPYVIRKVISRQKS